jgi:putative cell wall-binding protein
VLRSRLLPLLAVLAALVGLTVVVDAPGAGAAPSPSAPVSIPGVDDFPDPVVFKDGATWYAYATDGNLGEVQAIRSTDLTTWQAVGDVYDPPSWGATDDIWAPGVYRSSSGVVLYSSVTSTANDANKGTRCISAARATTPAGPFTAASSFKVCNPGQGGVIDPDVFQTATAAHLLWKTEGVPGQAAPAIWTQPLAADGLSLTGSPTKIFQSQYPWEGTLVENPTMVADGGDLYLFYSGNEWESADYAVGWAKCASVTGPCVAPPNKPLLKTEGPSLRGPGGGTVFRDGDQWWLGFAAWVEGGTTEETGSRRLFFRKLEFRDGRPVLASASGAMSPQPLAARIAGANRYDTAALFSANLVQAQRPVAYVATGASFADALAAGPASGFEGSPVLLVERDAVPASVKAELCRVNPGHIVVMGGAAAISQRVYDEVRTCAKAGADPIHREEGVNRYHTASLVSRNTYDPGVGVVYVATGENFADALAGGAAGAWNKGPLLLVQRDGIPFDTGVELDRLNPQRIVVLGGTGSVSENVLNQIRQYGPVTRIAGATRYDTAAQVARTQFGPLVGGLVVATGQSFPDAVAAGAAGFPIILVPSGGSAPAEAKAAIEALKPLGVVVLGGQGAVPDQTLASLGL